jgi:hypothetical protein
MAGTKRRLSRRWQIVLIAIPSAILLFLLTIRLLAGPILGHELVGMIQSKLNARLTVGDISYDPPYGLSLHDCHLVFVDPTSGAATSLLDLGELSVSLAELPIHGGPLQIKELTIREPVIHLVRTSTGFVGQNGLLRPDNSPQSPNHQKLSEILRLEHVGIEHGELIYEDQTGAMKHPVIWKGIGINIGTHAESAAAYQFKINASTGDLSELKAIGRFNVDELSGGIEPFSLAVQVDPDKTASELPPEFQSLLEQYKVKGTLVIDGSAIGSVSDPGSSMCQATMKLHNASAYSPQLRGSLDNLDFEISASANGHGATATVASFSARTGDATLSLKQPMTVSVDPTQQTWSLKGLAGAFVANVNDSAHSHSLLNPLNPNGSIEFSADLTGPASPTAPWPRSVGQLQVTTKNLTVQPTGCIAPVAISVGAIRLSGNVLVIRQIQARYGGDEVMLSSARVALPMITQGLIRASEIIAEASMHSPGLPYPQPLGDILKQYQIAGHLALSGQVTADLRPPQPKLDYDLLVSGDHGATSLYQVPVTGITFDGEAKTDLTQLVDFQCQALNGTITANSGKLLPRPPFNFSVNIFTDGLDIGEGVRLIAGPSSGPQISGLANIAAWVRGAGPDGDQTFLDQFKSEGQFEVAKGNLWTIPTLKKIEESASVVKSALTVGRAAAKFRISDQTIEIQDGAVSSPAFGVMGWGTATFDGMLDLHVVAVPLGDWRAKLSQTSDFLGDVAGSVQDFLNQTTEHLFYSERVTGPASDPKIFTAKGSSLSKKDAQTIGNMVQQSNDEKPMDLLNQPTAPAGK